jgi:HK97 family phage major capsid protein/HK97 family phage prohead protease
MNRAYSTIEIKGVSDAGGKRTFSGIASTPSTDRTGDIVEPKGAQFKLPIPLLWQHDSKQPIGWITAAKVTDKGIEVQGEVAMVEEDGALKQRLTDAWQMLKAKLVRGLSIGFNSIESARIDGTYGMRFMKWEWLELSAVTIAANQEASITAIKSADQALLAASGQTKPPDRGRDPSPGVSGTKQQPAKSGFFYAQTKGTEMKTLAELREMREQSLARQKELLDLRAAESRKFSADEAKEFDDLTAAVEELADDIRVKQFEAANSSGARSVHGKSADEGSRSRGITIHMKSADKDEDFKGQNYIRQIIAKTWARLNDVSSVGVAEARWGKSNPTLVRLIKASVAGGGSGSGEWGAELVTADTRYQGDFLEYLYSMTVYDRLPLRRVPANVMIKGQDGQGTGYWVGESKSIGVTALDFVNVSLTPLKVGAMAVVSNEWMRDSDPAGEMLVRDALVQASSQRVDTTFLSATAASSGVSPAGMLNGVTALFSAGQTADNVRADIEALYAPFITAKNASGLHIVTTPSLAKSISLMRNTLGQREFDGLSAAGGMLEGDPCITGDNVGAGDFILLKPSDIYRIGDSGVQVSMSQEATIEQDTAPAGASDTPVAQTSYPVSMFQSESTAFKVVRSINFAKRRTTAVAYIGDAAYGYAGT